jgi:hypothetical protein
VIHDDLAEQTQVKELRLESEIGRQCQAEVTLLIAAEHGSIPFGWSLPLQQVIAPMAHCYVSSSSAPDDAPVAQVAENVSRRPQSCAFREWKVPE